MAMEDFSSVFLYQDSVEDLKQKLTYMAYELQSARMQAIEEAKKNKENTENIKSLLHLLQIAYKERDEAKQQLQLTPTALPIPIPIPIPSPERRTSSGLTDSDPNSASHGDSLYDVISPVINSSPIDPETRAIFDLAKGKTLPEKGRLLEAVMEAGPLLQTILMSGSLPQWRNPPPIQPLPVPPVGISGLYGNNKPCGLLDFSGGGFAVSAPKRQRIQ